MKNETIEKWNRAADVYAEMQEEDEFVLVNKKVVTERFQSLLRKRVLDLGCGYGWYTDFFSSIGANVTGCDGSERMLELAREKYPDCNFECIDIEKSLPYENNSFDLVFCNQVIMDILNVEELLEEPISCDGVTKSKEFPLFLFAEFRK